MKSKIISLVLIAMLSSCGLFSKSNYTKEGRKKEFNKLFAKLHKSKAFNGNVLIAEKGEIIFEKSYGIANEATKEKLNIHTIFELASASKQFTAMGIVLLQKQGKIGYNDDILKYIPELDNYKGITVKNLLIHTSGLPDYMGLMQEYWDKSKIAENKDVIELLRTYRPEIEFKPNEKWNYSNTGYLLLATIIERVSGQSFSSFLKENIFNPLKMNNTFVYRRRFQPKSIVNYAEGYVYSDSLKKKVVPDSVEDYNFVFYMDGIVGDGVVNSNLYDLLKWDRALYGSNLVNEEDKKLIFSSYKTYSGEETAYGFGWMIDSTETFGKIVSHSGAWPGYISYIERHIDNDKTIILLQNNATINSEIPIKETRRILYVLPENPPVIVDVELLKMYTGVYLTEEKDEVEIVLKDGALYVVIQSKIKLELIPETTTKFVLEKIVPEIKIEFIQNENGKIEKYIIQQGAKGKPEEAIKV